jgi:hypothetical protein
MKPMMIAVAAALAMAAPAHAQAPAAAPAPAEQKMADHLINRPQVDGWYSWGLTPGPRPQAVTGVTGGKAMVFDIKKAGNPWDVGMVTTNTGAIRKGDVILLGVWVRRASGPAGSRIPLLMLESTDEPKTLQAKSQDIPLGEGWQMLYASGRATADFAEGKTVAVMQMGRDAQVLEVGPALMFDFGPDYDPARLPTNPAS